MTKSVKKTRTSKQVKEEILNKPMVRVRWEVIAGPPGTPKYIYSLEDPERTKVKIDE